MMDKKSDPVKAVCTKKLVEVKEEFLLQAREHKQILGCKRKIIDCFQSTCPFSCLVFYS